MFNIFSGTDQSVFVGIRDTPSPRLKSVAPAAQLEALYFGRNYATFDFHRRRRSFEYLAQVIFQVRQSARPYFGRSLPQNTTILTSNMPPSTGSQWRFTIIIVVLLHRFIHIQNASGKCK